MDKNFKSSYESTRDLYKNFLSEIKDIKFTLREVDIIACVIHNRGEKKIAILLDISPKTVSAHVYNILNKMGFNSKDQIIDFIENAGQSAHFREYYLHLLLKIHFKKFLKKVSNNLNKAGLELACSHNEKLANEILFEAIERDCNIANISLKSVSENIDTDLERFDFKKISAENYYLNFVEYILSLIPKEGNQEVGNGLKEEFLKSYQYVQDSYSGKVLVEIQGKPQSSYAKPSLLLMGITIIVFAYYNLFLTSRGSPDSNFQTGQEIVQNLEDFLIELNSTNFSADNASRDSLYKNSSLFKKVEKIIDYSNEEAVKSYFQNASMTSEYLNIYLYNIQALASYYMANLHDVERAQIILFHAKDLAENYTNSRTGSNCNFDELRPEEVLTELGIINELPQTYSRIIYLLGRSYIYLGDMKMSEKYFQLSKYIANRFDLFETYMSDRSGLFRIRKYKASNLISQGKIEEASDILEQIVKDYKELISNNREYILDFKPNSTEQNKIILSEDAYNIIESIEISINIFNRLLSLHPGLESKKSYLSKIEDIFTGVDQNLNELLSKLNLRKTAVFYNNLGNTCVLLTDTALDASAFIQIITTKLNIKSSNIFDIAEELFNKANDASRSNDYTKADSFDGLARLYDKRIKQLERIKSDFSEQEIKKLKATISNLEEKRDHINKILNRAKVY